VLIKEINKQLAVPVDVSGVNISLRKFPNASFVFTDVFSSGAYSSPGDTLVYAQRIYLQFSVWEVLFSSVSIKEIDVEKAVVNIRLRSDGRDNYRIWKEDTSSSQGLFTLERVDLEDIHATTEDQGSGFRSAFFINDLTFKGNFEESDYRLENKGSLQVQNLWVNENRYLHAVPLEVVFTLAGYGEDSVVVKPASLQWKDLSFEVSTTTARGQTSVQASSASMDLNHVQQLLHEQGWYTLKDAELKGKGNARFSGTFASGQDARFQLDFSTTGASVSGYKGARIHAIDCSGRYTYKAGSDELHVNRFRGKGETGSIEGDLLIRELSSPFVKLNMRSDLELAEWLVVLPLDTVEEPRGKIVMDVHFENQFGSLKTVKAAELRKARTEGSLSIQEASFQFLGSDKSVKDINGELAFMGNDLKVKRLYLKTGQSDIYLEGRFENVLNYILLEDEKLLVDCSVRSQEIDLSDFVGSSKKGNDSYNLNVARSLDLDLRVGVDRFGFKKFQASGITGNLSIHDGLIKVSDLSLKADQGSYKGYFSVDLNTGERYKVDARLGADNIEIHDLFVSFGDFGQEAIAADHIYGRATADIDFTSFMLPDLTVLTETVEMTANIRIRDGNLKNYEPMQALSRFADIKELEDVRFNSLNNTISIKESQVIIPRMDVESNVLSLQISGIHDFDNRVNYTMRLKLDDVLFNNRARKSGKSEFDEHLVEVKNNDDPYIYVKMTGKASDPEISLDRKSLGESISRDLKEQGKEIREIFKKKEPEKKEDPGIIFEWEEEEPKKNQN
ncbi:MAG TPA: hypothetical protein DDW81_11515, partial [Cryomorphaceae bacterium]|nr:hypothetical protein [Cryomorphaceae bacterium]